MTPHSLVLTEALLILLSPPPGMMRPEPEHALAILELAADSERTETE